MKLDTLIYDYVIMYDTRGACMDSTVSTQQEARSIAAQINGDGLDCEKIVTSEDEVRALLERNAEKIPPVGEMLERLKKYESCE
ncbi:MAG: hypothetical protein PHP59_04670 [Methanofollis sp.]|uniref:hypothetical protein n=1 Tax=Methanofollis sp. TaxID=2052835 RepID=UPI0026058E0E|nr:hypothetical protein [Methanofollis sp.]MDD4254654.1 hypothetical protein [Methanofollis sp.]